MAGPPGQWTKVHDADGNTTEVGLARTSNGLLNVLWYRDADNAVVNTQVAANGSGVIGPAHGVRLPRHVRGVSSMWRCCRRRAVGCAPSSRACPRTSELDERMATATSFDGVSWAVQPTPASDDRTGLGSPVYAAQGIGGTIANNGTPISIWGDSSPGAAGYHIGTSSNEPDIHFGGPSATVGGPNVATDSVSGQVVIAWSDLDSGRTLVQSIAPAGARTNTPGGQAPDALERVGMATRAGGGVFIAYLRGTNLFDSRMAVWRFGAGQPDGPVAQERALPRRRARPRRTPVGVLGSPAGQLPIFAARSNEAATQFGARVELKQPGRHRRVSQHRGRGNRARRHARPGRADPEEQQHRELPPAHPAGHHLAGEAARRRRRSGSGPATRATRSPQRSSSPARRSRRAPTARS